MIMRTVINPAPAEWLNLVRRPTMELEFLESNVRYILNLVRKSGDAAIRELTQRYESASVSELAVSQDEIAKAPSLLSAELKAAIDVAASNIRKFHESQRREFSVIETMPGVSCWRKAVPIDRVGIYIPGGTAPLFSTVLMLAIPAQLAGCREVILCSPVDGKTGAIHPAVIYAASKAGVSKMFKAGGAQAIAALAYGTKSIPAVSKIFGPGNQYVTMAKQLVSQEGTAIDMPAGPSEVLVLADTSANPAYIAADLLSQAEHGKDSQVVLVANDKSVIEATLKEIESQISTLPRKDIARDALSNSLAVVFNNGEDSLSFINEYAPEHLIINTSNAAAIADKVMNAGSVFIGAWSPESVGDYASGTNHTLPTNGYAKAYSGVSLESFQKFITFQSLTDAGLKAIGGVVETMAEAEELAAHKRAISVRLKDIR